MKDYFIKLYRYNQWANKRVLGGLEDQEVEDKQILTIMSHVISALFIWLSRIEGKSPEAYPLWKQYSLIELAEMNEEITTRWLKFVEETEDFNRELVYNNYVGDPYKNNVEQIMIHLVNHSTYHRAQVALLLRQKGLEPINTDFITYDRVITGQWKD
ncbi:MAG: DinB family protein [Cyclobacteriaceae bacterium]|nr:DinB family protein [Cyclobacteriaceae bacterium]